MTSRRLALAAATLVAIAALAVVVGRHQRSGGAPAAASAHHPPPPAQAGPRELAFVAPIAPGAAWQGWTVKAVSAVFRGSVRVVLERGSDRVVLTIVKAGAGPQPPAEHGPYAVYYSIAKKSTAGDADVLPLAQALAAIVDRNRASEPPGLGPFHVDPQGPDYL